MLETCYASLGQPFCDFVAGAIVFIVVAIVIVVIAALILLVVAFRQVRYIDIPEGADFFETLRLVPITVPLSLDLLDLAFDIFAAPIAWIILEAMGLKALQLVTVTEGIIPGTQALPTLTLAWIVARLTSPGRPTVAERRIRDRERDLAGEIEARRAARRRGRRAALPAADDSAEGRADYREEEEFFTYDEEDF